MGLSSLIQDLSTKDPRACELAIGAGELTDDDIYKLRYQYGPNLGALFVQEKWIDDSLFNENADGSSELSALQSWGNADQSELQKRWEDHWQNFVTEQDFELMKQRGVTCVRLPIGFWSLGESKLLKKTPFEKYAKVYEHSWSYVKRIIDMAAKFRVGVLLDFHALPGGVNGDEHSGTSSGNAEFWEHKSNRELAIKAFEDAANKIQGLQNIVGLQLVNEAPYGQSKAPGFYLDAAAAIRAIDCKLPIVTSDGWDVCSLVDTIKKWNEKLEKGKTIPTTNIIADTHVYRTFTDEDKNKSAEQHIKEAPTSVQPCDDVDIVVGEWSCCLDEETWKKSQGDRGNLEVEYGQAQLQCFKQLAGNFFWTYKFGQGNGGSWDWRVMSEKGVIMERTQPGQGDCQAAIENALGQHKQYWEGVDSNTDWENWRFEEGFKLGWNDAERFAQFDGSRPGLIAQLKTARTLQHRDAKGNSDKLWVFSQGYVQGLRTRASA